MAATFRQFFLSASLFGSALALTGESLAQANSPLPRPARESGSATAPATNQAASARSFKSENLSRSDEEALNAALKEADRKNWPEAMRHAGRLKDATAAKIVQWMRLISENSGATLA